MSERPCKKLVSASCSKNCNISLHVNNKRHLLQWMIVDYKLFKPGSPLVPNTLWILEQIPGTVMMADMTMKLVDETYWSSYNLP